MKNTNCEKCYYWWANDPYEEEGFRWEFKPYCHRLGIEPSCEDAIKRQQEEKENA